ARLAELSDAELDRLAPGWREYRQQAIDTTGQIKSGLSAVGDVLEPGILDALGPAAKAAKLAGIFAAMRKAGAAIPTELTKVADKLDGLLAGKAPSAEDLAPFKLNAQAKLTEQIRLANQTLVSKPGVVGAKGSGAVVDDLIVGKPSGGSTSSVLPASNNSGVGGFKVGLGADDIVSINSKFGGSISFREVDTVIANAANYDGFYNKAASMIRDIAGGHLFDNGNKRTAVEVVEQLIVRNGVDGPPKQVIWNVVDKVSTGKLNSVQDISKALRGLD
ncbi:hypothetical protein, partial [Pseudomonas indica]|uniref:hypothetical protein n=1 Tax=Pseudomonas indica TaxID=137658 RepID=UPI0023F97F52